MNPTLQLIEASRQKDAALADLKQQEQRALRNSPRRSASASPPHGKFFGTTTSPSTGATEMTMKKKLKSSSPLDAATCSLVFVAMDRVFRMSSGCPYCRARMTATADGWVQEDDGTWSADSVELHCAKEPDMEKNAWWQWCQDHCDSDFGAAWHAMQQRVIASLRKRFRFNPENARAMTPGANEEPLK